MAAARKTQPGARQNRGRSGPLKRPGYVARGSRRGPASRGNREMNAAVTSGWCAQNPAYSLQSQTLRFSRDLGMLFDVHGSFALPDPPPSRAGPLRLCPHVAISIGERARLQNQVRASSKRRTDFQKIRRPSTRRNGNHSCRPTWSN